MFRLASKPSRAAIPPLLFQTDHISEQEPVPILSALDPGENEMPVRIDLATWTMSGIACAEPQ
jgi:hypothetical protein